jgi:hypothetical protein
MAHLQQVIVNQECEVYDLSRGFCMYWDLLQVVWFGSGLSGSMQTAPMLHDSRFEMGFESRRADPGRRVRQRAMSDEFSERPRSE